MNYTSFRDDNSNVAIVAGTVSGEPKKSHNIDGENFYEFFVNVKRLSTQEDVIPVTVPERILRGSMPQVGDFVELKGEYRSYNKVEENHSRLILHLFAKECAFLTSEKNENELHLAGFVCKEPVYRKTPFDREICDVLLAVNRMNFRKSDYIPCILWGRNARFMADQGVGTKIEITGRIQSREYTKKLEDGNSEVRVAYEVSCQSVAVTANVEKMIPLEVENPSAVNN